MDQQKLNSVYSSLAAKRRYEVWFLKLLLSDGGGAWWFRYLLTNPGRLPGGGCQKLDTMPLQIWATHFPVDGQPQSNIQGFTLDDVTLSHAGDPLSLSIAGNHIDHDSCRGNLEVNGHKIEWDLRYHSTSGFSMSDVGWIGFSRTPHTDAIFDGWIRIDGREFGGSPLGYGLQGHNCGYRHRNLWSWTHLLSLDRSGQSTTFEALEYEIGMGFYFRKALLWHKGRLHVLKKFETDERSRERMIWSFKSSEKQTGLVVRAIIDGSGSSHHRLPYTATDCSGTFEVANNSLAKGTVVIEHPDGQEEGFEANAGAVLEMVGGK